MKFLYLALFFLLSSCNALPQLYQTAEDIANDDAIYITVSREAINKQTDVNVSVDIKNTQQK